MPKSSTLFTKPRLNGGKHTNPNRDEASLRREIEALERTVKITAIVAVPVLVAIVAVLLGFWRVRRRARRAEEPLAATG